MNTPTPTPRTDAAWSATFDGEQMSAGRTARALRECSQQLETELAALTAERDQLRFENSNLRAGQKACEACDEPTAFEVRQLRARAERAEAELADQAARFHDEIVSRQGTVRANKKLDLEERDQLRAELATAQAQAKLWEDKCHELIAPHYILDPCLRAHKFREALQYHPVLPTPFWKKYGGPNDT